LKSLGDEAVDETRVENILKFPKFPPFLCAGNFVWDGSQKTNDE
jgi:hypothetical protein